MAEKDFVKATVVDIRRPAKSLPRQVAVDASVLYFFYYPNFTNLRLAGGAVPQPYQLREYPPWVKRLLQARTRLYASGATFGEFVRLAEYAELEAVWVTDPNRQPGQVFTPRICKQVRYDQTPAALAAVRRRTQTYLQAARKSVDLLPRWPAEADEHDAVLAEWLTSAGDFGDATLVANAKFAQVPHVLADDIDLLTFDGITVYTANKNAIDAARDAGKLA